MYHATGINKPGKHHDGETTLDARPNSVTPGKEETPSGQDHNLVGRRLQLCTVGSMPRAILPTPAGKDGSFQKR